MMIRNKRFILQMKKLTKNVRNELKGILACFGSKIKRLAGDKSREEDVPGT